MRRRRKRRQEEGSRKDEEEEEEWRRRSVATIVCRPLYFSTPHGRTVFSIESCGYCITFNLCHLPGDMIITGQTLNFLRTRPLRLASHSELARLNIMSWNSTLCILL